MRIILFISLILCLVLSCKKPVHSEAIKVNTTDEVFVINADSLKNDILTVIPKERLLGKVNYKTDSLFVKVDGQHSTKELYLNKECYDGFIVMYNKAKEDGIELKIISGTRSFTEQKAIWERKWNRYNQLPPKERALKILEYSSMPSTSRHHWGTDIDVNNLNNSYFETGKGKQEYEWLKTHANAFGFYQVYTSKDNGRTGYNEEKWHWSYLPLASKYLNAYNTNIVLEDINSFLGYDTAIELNVIANYVNGISETAKSYKN